MKKNIAVVGCGYWGRPEMAYFKFVSSILNNKPIDIYNNEEMYRDFTDVDDLVNGIKLLGEYPEYHTSLDDLENVVTPEGPEGSYIAIKKAIEAIERNKFYKVNVWCEPIISKRELYPNLNDKSVDKVCRTRMNFLSLCDGQTSLLEIAEYLNLSIWKLYEIVNLLKKYNLIDEN